MEEEVWVVSAASVVEELLESSSPLRSDSAPLVMDAMVDSTHSLTSPAQPRTRLAISEA